ncbi:MAG: MinD/ParA family protein [Bacteroidales bacterium]|nr:MinD/ParA family protein [Bacteroidales bacterium]MCM1415609.1 MinD/ParA family protein [bacterium]MCM1423002.1 MinD/ParA family protein [bacterium]
MDQAEQLRRIIKGSAPPKRPLARIITVTSGKGGVGKSNTAINLAIQFRKMEQKVIILDADFGLANIEIMFGAVPKHNLCDFIYQGKSIKDIITWGPMDVGFISGGSGITGMSNLDKDNLSAIIGELSELDEMADTIIVDTGAGIADAVLEFLVASGEILLVTTPEPTSITDSYSLLKALSRHPRYLPEATQIRVLANKVTGEKEAQALYAKLQTVVERYLKVPISYLGMIPQDPQLAQAVMQQMPVSLEQPRARSAMAYEAVAAKLMNREVDQKVKRRGMAAFFSHIIGR